MDLRLRFRLEAVYKVSVPGSSVLRFDSKLCTRTRYYEIVSSTGSYVQGLGNVLRFDSKLCTRTRYLGGSVLSFDTKLCRRDSILRGSVMKLEEAAVPVTTA